MPNSILIADDHAFMRKAVRSVLEDAGFTICAEAADGVDAVRKVNEFSPDLIVLDVRMPKLNGIEVASILKARVPRIPIVALTMYGVSPPVASAAGITAVVAKSEGLSKLRECVQKLLGPKPNPPRDSSN